MTTFETLKVIDVLSSAISKLGLVRDESTQELYLKLIEAVSSLDLSGGDSDLASHLQQQGLPSGKGYKREAPSDVYLKGTVRSGDIPDSVVFSDTSKAAIEKHNALTGPKVHIQLN